MNRAIVRLMLALLVFAPITVAESNPAKARPQAPPTGEPSVATQSNDASAEAAIRELEQQVEAAIVSGDTLFLMSVYADDFRMAHATGQIENRTQWLENVARRSFVSRKIVALDVDIHGSVVVTYGKLDMTIRNAQGEHSILLKYIRVYEEKNGHWQMLMHRSFNETTTAKTSS